MTYPTKNSDVSATAWELVPGQYIDAAIFKAFVDALTSQVQPLEDAAWELLTLRFLAVAEGAQLDVIGEHVGLTRQGLGDEWYRTWLYIQIAINSSQGDAERLIDLTLRISRAQFVHYLCKFPAVALLYSHVACDVSKLSLVQRAAPAGVRVVQVASTDANVFVLGGDYDAAGALAGGELSYGAGFGEVGTDVYGGKLSEVYE